MTKTNDWFEVSTVGDLLVRGASLYPSRDAIVFPEERRTYTELMENATSIARGLLALGVRPGEHVGLMSTNCPEFVEGFFAVSMLGCVAVPINARHKASEIGFIVDNSNVVALLTTADAKEYTNFTQLFCDALPSLDKADDCSRLDLEEAPNLRATVLLRGEGRKGFLGRSELDKLAQSESTERVNEARLRVKMRDLALIIYTSGTTANPKGCMLTHEAVVRGSVHRAQTRFKTNRDGVHWNPGPLFHIAALAPFLGVIGTFGTYLTDAFFDAGRAVKLMTDENVTMIWPWFPAIVQGVLDHPDFDASRLNTLEKIMLIGPPALVKRVQNTFPEADLFQACGMSETAGIFALTAEDETAEERATTQGKSCPGVEVRIIDPATGKDQDIDKVGEILVRGYCVMEGYYRDAEKTASALDSEGWLHTGDLYRRSGSGNLEFNGRLKDMLKVGGENVAAIEIESYLCEHPAVAAAEVVGKPDSRLDEVPVAFVELRPGCDLDPQELIEFCQGNISSFKVPRAVFLMEKTAWPMSATKVNKRALRQMVAEDSGSQSS